MRGDETHHADPEGQAEVSLRRWALGRLLSRECQGKTCALERLPWASGESRSKGVGGEATGGVPEAGRFILQVREDGCNPVVSVIEASGQIILPSKN